MCKMPLGKKIVLPNAPIGFARAGCPPLQRSGAASVDEEVFSRSLDSVHVATRLSVSLSMAALSLGQVFPDLRAARQAITSYCAAVGKDWKCAKADSTRVRAVCGCDPTCEFLALVCTSIAA